MDSFAEQLVKKQNTTKDDMKRACIIIIAITVTIISILLVCMGFALAMILPVCAIWGLYYFLKMLSVEYEYSCTNGILDIDKILGKSKRKEMLSIEVKNFTVYGKAGSCPEEDEDNGELTTFSVVGTSCMSGRDDAEEYYAEFEHPEHGKCCLYFTPNAELRSALEPFLSKELRKQLGGNLF